MDHFAGLDVSVEETTVLCTASGLTAPNSGGPGRLQRRENRTGSSAIGGNSSSTERWEDVPRGTMDEVSSYVRLDPMSVRRQGRPKDCSASSSNPMMEDAMGRRRGYCTPSSLM
jgi:hypothetical protein